MGSHVRAGKSSRQATLILLPLFINCRLCWREGGLGEKVEPRTCACWKLELNLKLRIGDLVCLRICVRLEGREGGGIFHHLISFKNIGFDVFIPFEP